MPVGQRSRRKNPRRKLLYQGKAFNIGLLDEQNFIYFLILRPDFSQMIPYKPKANAYPGEHPLGGGTFPQPPALAQLCGMLPPPQCFRGPFVSVDKLMDIFNRIQLPDGEFCF